jgi:methyl-accepting chemotaxis protein
MKIATKLYLGFFIVIFLMGISTVFIYAQSRSANSNFVALLMELDVAHKQYGRAKNIVWLDEVLTQSTRNYIFTKDIAWKNRYDSYGAQLDGIIAAAIANSKDAETKDIFNRQNEANLALVEMELRAHDLVKAKKTAQALVIIDGADYKKWKAVYAETVQEFLQSSMSFMETAEIKLDENCKNLDGTLRLAGLIVGLAILFSCVFIMYLVKLITEPIEKFADMAARISRGDLRGKIEGVGGPDFADLSTSFARMTASVKILMGEPEIVKKPRVVKKRVNE